MPEFDTIDLRTDSSLQFYTQPKPEDTILSINMAGEPDAEGRYVAPRVMVTIKGDGRVEIGEGVTLDEAADAFWECVQMRAPQRPTEGA